MNPLRRLALVLSSLSLVLTALVLAPVQSADASQPGDYSLSFSSNLDRSGGQLLDGGTVPADQDIAVYLDTPGDTVVDWVTFFVDGHFEKVEFEAPFDLAGTLPDNTAAPRSFGAGSYHVEAWYQVNGSVGTSYASFSAYAAGPPPVSCSTIAEIALGDPQFSTLVTALSAASDAGTIDFLAAVSNNDADLTVFAPTNDAFAALDPAVLDAALADPAGLLTDVLAYHVVPASLTGDELVAQGTVTTLGGADVEVTFDPLYDRVLVNDSAVVLPNVDACNGIVHVIDNVLLPPAPEPPAPVCSTIAGIATSDPRFSTLVTALSAASNAGAIDFLAAVSNNDADLTVFAPTNDAFAALDPAVLDAALADPAGLLTDVLAYHVLATSQTGAELLNAGTATTLLGADVTATTDGSNVFINNSQVIAPNVEACNGIIHVINSVLLPPAPEPPAPVCSTIAEIATADGAPFSTLVMALSAASGAGDIDFIAAVSNPDAELTVFAPTDAAFATLDPAVLDAALADPAGLLTDVLAYHVLGSAQDGATLASAGSATTLLGEDVTITADGSNLFINESLVLTGNVEACNGIVHVIDNVLLPPAPEPPAPVCSSIAEIATSDPQFSTLVTALSAASNAGAIDFLAAVSNNDADLTVFAPTDAAFAALDPAVLDAALADPAGLLTDVLAYHVLATSQTGAELLAAGTATTLLDEDVTATTDGSNVFINNSQVIAPNVEACNGIVHVIDNVLLPPAPAADDVISDGKLIVLRNVDRDRYLDADPRRTGYNVDLSRTVSADDEWILEAVGDGTWRLLNGVYGRYLDADGRRAHYNVNLSRNPNAYGVEWEIIPQGDGLYALRAVDLNRFLDADHENVDTSARIGHDDIWEILPAS